MRLKTTGILSAAALIASASAVTAAAGSSRDMSPRPALVSAHGSTVRSSVGSYCTTGRAHHGVHAGMCADSVYPHPHSRLAVSGGDVLHVRFPHNRAILDRPWRVVVTLVRIRHDGVSTVDRGRGDLQVPGHPRRWLASIPRRLHNANAVDISVSYGRNGDADFVAGLRSR